MLDDLLTEQFYPGSDDLDSLPIAKILGILNAADAEVPLAVGREIPQIEGAVNAIADALKRDGHLVYIGAGTSGRLGVLDAAECLPV
jgi:N-acetylmuramic acid 6-phosphate etherase